MSTFIPDKWKYYKDGITRINDPFWYITCELCGKTYMSCTCLCKCPSCGCMDGDRTLGGKTYDEIVAERGEPDDTYCNDLQYFYDKNEKIRVNQNKSE